MWSVFFAVAGTEPKFKTPDPERKRIILKDRFHLKENKCIYLDISTKDKVGGLVAFFLRKMNLCKNTISHVHRDHHLCLGLRLLRWSWTTCRIAINFKAWLHCNLDHSVLFKPIITVTTLELLYQQTPPHWDEKNDGSFGPWNLGGSLKNVAPRGKMCLKKQVDPNQLSLDTRNHSINLLPSTGCRGTEMLRHIHQCMRLVVDFFDKSWSVTCHYELAW